MEKNVDKYLKENVDIEKLAYDITAYMSKDIKPQWSTATTSWTQYTIQARNVYNDIVEFFKQPVYPHLNEEEKTILKSLDSRYVTITKSKDNDLIIIDAVNIRTKHLGGLKPSMFHCIKQDELYSIQELLKGK